MQFKVFRIFRNIHFRLSRKSCMFPLVAFVITALKVLIIIKEAVTDTKS